MRFGREVIVVVSAIGLMVLYGSTMLTTMEHSVEATVTTSTTTKPTTPPLQKPAVKLQRRRSLADNLHSGIKLAGSILGELHLRFSVFNLCTFCNAQCANMLL